MTNTEGIDPRTQSMIDAIAPETNDTWDFEMLSAQYKGLLGTDDLIAITRATLPTGRYGARIRNIIRRDYPWFTPSLRD